MKKILCGLLVLLMLCGVFALSAAAEEAFDEALDPAYAEALAEADAAEGEEVDEEADDDFDAELYARGEALLRETLGVLTGGGWTIHENYSDAGILSYNGKLFASTWGIGRAITLFGEGVLYKVNRNYRMYFDLSPNVDSDYVRELVTLVNLKIEELEFRVSTSAQSGPSVYFDAGGFEYSFFYDTDDNLYLVWMSVRTSANSRSTNSIHIKEILPTAQQNLFDLRLMLKMPGVLYQPLSILFFPFDMMRLLIRTLGDLIGIRWW